MTNKILTKTSTKHHNKLKVEIKKENQFKKKIISDKWFGSCNLICTI